MNGIKLINPIIIDGLDDEYQPFPNVDAKYGPYVNLDMAKSVLENYLIKGLTIGIIENGVIVEYWIEDDTLQFVKKNKDTKTQPDWNETDENSSTYIQNKPELSKVATSGSYDDLSDKPNIPTVNDGELTLTVGKKITKFKANQSDNATFSVEASDLEPANENFGVVKTTSSVTNTAGYTPCPIVNGVPYYETINLEESNNYITIIDDSIIELLSYLNQNGEYDVDTYHINFPSNRIIFYKGVSIHHFCTENGTILGTLIPGNFYITKSSDYRAYNYNEELKTVVWGECINIEYQTNGYNKLSIEYSKPTTIDYTKDIIEIHDNSNEETVELFFDYPNDKMLKGKHIKIFYFNNHSSTNKTLNIKSTDGKCYIVGDSAITYHIAYGNKCIMIDIYILDENLIINVTENINKK